MLSKIHLLLVASVSSSKDFSHPFLFFRSSRFPSFCVVRNRNYDSNNSNGCSLKGSTYTYIFSLKNSCLMIALSVKLRVAT